MCSPRTKETRNRALKYRASQVPSTQLLLEETRRGTAVHTSVRHVDRVEPEAAATEAEVRRAPEPATGIERVFVARAVEPEAVIVLQALWMRQQHDADFECTQTELPATLRESAHTTHGLAAMRNAKLSTDDEDVAAFLLTADHFKGLRLLSGLAEAIRSELTFAVVHELAAALLRELAQHELRRLIVGRGDELPARNREVAFGTGWNLLLRERLVPRLQLRKVPPQNRNLIGNRLGSRVVERVAVGGGNFFVGMVIICHRHRILERLQCSDHLGHLCGRAPAHHLDSRCAQDLEPPDLNAGHAGFRSHHIHSPLIVTCPYQTRHIRLSRDVGIPDTNHTTCMISV